jgi:hypothetical protein
MVWLYTAVIVLAVVAGIKGWRTPKIPWPWNEMEKEDHRGWLYFIGNGTGPIKVGVTRDKPSERLKGLQTGNPTKLRVIYSLEIDDVFKWERAFHSALSGAHVQGEWYEREAVLLLIDELSGKALPENVVSLHRAGSQDPF